jgi:hypothetical protein
MDSRDGERTSKDPTRAVVSPFMKNSFLAAFLLASLGLLPGSGLAAQSSAVVEQGLPPEARQFDFWIGTWSVNLRIHQRDLSWKDEVKAEARIHSILRGKALLELWDGGGIKGMSLRYFDTTRRTWVMWLDWPGRNRSGSFRMEGAFRHGRAEFEAKRLEADGGEVITRYTFSDITDRSLRWDDAFSRDGGRTWSHNWIMEFTRTAPTAELPPRGGNARTWVDGSRCSLQSFHRWDGWAGLRTGTLDGEPATLRGYRILDGCAVLLTLSLDARPGEAWVGQLTFNTYARRSELLALDAEPDAPARVFYTSDEPDDDAFVERVAEGVPLRRVTVRRPPGGPAEIVWEERSGPDASWRETRRASFR